MSTMTVNKSGKLAIPKGVDPVGLVEISARLQVARDTVDKWQHRGLLPESDWTVGGRPAWNWSTIVRWLNETDRVWLVTEAS